MRLQSSYVFMGDGYTVASNTAYWNTSQDAPNPLNNRKTNSNGVALDSTLLYRLPIEGGRWQATGSVLWGQDNMERLMGIEPT